MVPNSESCKKLFLLRAFGHIGEAHICPGINAKMSELHAAMGLCLLLQVTGMLERRAHLAALYDDSLEINSNPGLRLPSFAPGLAWNHAYYPVVFRDHTTAMRVVQALEKLNIHPRRYFYPSLNRLPYVQGTSCPVAEDISERVLCLPFWPDMSEKLVRLISCTVLQETRW